MILRVVPAAVLLAIGPAAAQAPGTVVPEKRSPDVIAPAEPGTPRTDTPAPGGPGDNAGRPRESLSDRLGRTDGVLRPPPSGDSGTVIRPPEAGTTPVIPPPGTPGGDPSVTPK